MDKRILIIDDNVIDQRMMKIYLRKAGFRRVSLADSGEQGVEMARRETPALVIVDTLLPGMNGHETCREIKKIFPTHMKVIVATGLVDAVDAGTARKAGADDYVVKTVDCSHVVQAVQRALSDERGERP